MHINGVNEGPMPAEQVRLWLAHNRISGQHLVWRSGMATWKPLAQTELAPLAGYAAPPASMAGPAPQNVIPLRAADSGHGAALDPATFDPSAFGGFWVRAAAYVVDNLILMALNIMVVTTCVVALGAGKGQIVAFPINMLTGLGYFVLLQTRMQGSVGKKIFGLVLVDERLQPLSDKQAMRRYMMLLLGTLPLYAGGFAIAFHSRKRGWHDRWAGTYVMRRQALERILAESATAPDAPGRLAA